MPWRRSIIPALLLFAVLWTVAGSIGLPPRPSPGLVTEEGFTATPLHPNDLAAALVLVLPWLATAALAIAWRGDGRRSPRWLSALLIGGLAVGLASMLWVTTGSRGGLLAAGVGVAVAWTSLGRRGRRALLVLVLVIGLVTGSAAARFGADALVETVGDALRDHDSEGVTVEHLLSGRVAIWRQAGRIVQDFPLFGAGVHGYAALVPGAYPMPPGSFHEASRGAGPLVADSHSLFLELAVVHGVPATLALLALVACALVRLARRARGDETRPAVHAAGALGGLVAFLVHGTADVAALATFPFGTAIQLAFWLVVAWGLRDPDTPRPRDRLPVALLIALATLLLVGSAATVSGLVDTEASHRRAFHALQDDTTAPGASLLDALENGSCRSQWWFHRLARYEAEALAGLRRLASCAPHRIPDLRALAPFHPDRARAAREVASTHPDALLWRAWSLPNDASEPPPLGRLYDAYLARRPKDGDVWYEAARRLERGDAWRLAALTQACVHGDPGANACWGAGRLARRMDLPPAVVVHLLRRSHWQRALDFADEIEAADKKSAAPLTKRPRSPV